MAIKSEVSVELAASIEENSCQDLVKPDCSLVSHGGDQANGLDNSRVLVVNGFGDDNVENLGVVDDSGVEYKPAVELRNGNSDVLFDGFVEDMESDLGVKGLVGDVLEGKANAFISSFDSCKKNIHFQWLFDPGGTTVVDNLLSSDDIHYMLGALRSLGLNVEEDKVKQRAIVEAGNIVISIQVLRNVTDNFSQHKIQRVGVRHSKRSLKELSALFTGQDIKAHEGSILTMKFSLDGQYLASAGEDRIVRVWQVVEDERSDTNDIPDADPSCVYFSVNQLSELGPLTVERDNVNKSRTLRKTPDSACVIFPPKVFRILEKPMHEFQGHDGEILDLSWSKDNCLLSSSVDKTVRLWRVGVEHCLKVFSHSDYVTSIQFNPVTDDYFISGSIDGKVRIWDVNGCQVVEWAETKDIIAAVSYRPDGQGCVVGSITGICRFFNISDNHLQLESQMCLASKKKSPCKRISGFQFSPHDPNKVLVACADSQVRIIDGTSVIRKCKGLRNTGNQISASFTPDGKHIISASEDSNVYMWNSNEDSSLSQPKANKSFESFSSNASVALPWPGLKSSTINKKSIDSLPFSSSTCFSLTPEYIDNNSKGSATWPEEKLPVSSPWDRKSLMGKSQYKLFKTSCQSSSNSHAWGLVIVTAGWDGRIRSFHNYGLPVPL